MFRPTSRLQPTSRGPPAVFVGHEVNSTQNAYGFVVPAVEEGASQHYTVKVKITYLPQDNVQPPSSTLSIDFDAIAPTTSLGLAPVTLSTPLPRQGFQHDVADGAVILQVDPKITFQAQTTAATFPGEFMFMQLASAYSTRTDGNGVEEHNTTRGPALDDGSIDTETLNLGTENRETGDSSWKAGGVQVVRTSADAPSFQVEDTYQAFSVGTEQFANFLMYRPDGWSNVWIAVQEFDWSWSGAATNPWPADSSSALPPQYESTPSGGQEFPVWNTRTTDARWTPGP